MAKKYTILYLILLSLLAITTRFIFLEKSPPGFYVDEASFGYNALSVMESGRDEHGILLPLYFKAFGEYKNPIYCYSIIPFLKIFGVSVFSVRITSAFWGFATIILLFFVIKNFLKDVHGAFLSSLVLTLMPWHLVLSRVAFEVITFPFFIVLFLYFWEKYLCTLKVKFAFIAGMCMGTCFYTYSTARLFVPVYCLGVFIIWFKEINKKKLSYVAGMSGLLIPLIPLYFWLKKYPDTLSRRFSSVSIWNDKVPFFDNISNVFINYIDDFSVRYLFLSGDTNLRHSTGRAGTLLITYSILFLFGVLWIWRRRDDKFLRFIVLGFVTFPLAASLTREGFHALRSANAIPFISVILGVGFSFLLECIRNYKNLYQAGIVIIALLILVEFSQFYWDYLMRYPVRSEVQFMYSIPETMKFMMSQKADHLYFVKSISENQPLIQAKYFSRGRNSYYKGSNFSNFHVIKDFSGVFANNSYLLATGGEKPSENFKKVKEFDKIYSSGTAYTLYYIEKDDAIAPIGITNQELERGLKANYFYGTEWQGEPFLTKIENEPVFFKFDSKSKPYKAPFAVEWNGYISLSKKGSYKFATRSDDGSFVYINGRLIVDNGGRHPLRYASGKITLDEGMYLVKIKYFDSGGEAGLEWLWTSSGDNSREERVPAEVLFHKK